MKYLLILFIFTFSSLSLHSQYYTLNQINTIDLNRTANEGDFYLDTILKRYFIGITTGEVIELAVKVDSVTISNDSLRIYQGASEVSTPIGIAGDNSFDITQNSHGFIIPSWGILPLSYNTTSNLYQPAQANSNKNSASLLAILTKDGNTITVQNTGYLGINHGLDVGHWWMLSRSNPGQIIRSDTASCDTNDIYQRLFFTASVNKILLQPEHPLNCETSTTSGSSGSSGMITILPPCTTMIANYFNEVQYSWGFSVQNTGATAITQWQAVITRANYQLNSSNITNNSDFIHTEIDNGDGTYDHYFTSTSGLAGNSSSNNFQINSINFGFNPTSVSKSYNCL